MSKKDQILIYRAYSPQKATEVVDRLEAAELHPIIKGLESAIIHSNSRKAKAIKIYIPKKEEQEAQEIIEKIRLQEKENADSLTRELRKPFLILAAVFLLVFMGAYFLMGDSLGRHIRFIAVFAIVIFIPIYTLFFKEKKK